MTFLSSNHQRLNVKASQRARQEVHGVQGLPARCRGDRQDPQDRQAEAGQPTKLTEVGFFSHAKKRSAI